MCSGPALGYEVHLLDPVPGHIEQAKEKDGASPFMLASIREGDARALPFDDYSFDLVLLLGPLYHLTERSDRMVALGEARRVLKRGGMVAAAGISRYSSMLDGFHGGWLRIPDFITIMLQDLTDGQHRNPMGKNYFTTAFFHLPDELEGEVREAGFQISDTLAMESFASWLPGLEEKLADPQFGDLLLGTIRRIEQDPSLLGGSPHLLAVGKKP